MYLLDDKILKNKVLKNPHEFRFVVHPRSTKMYKVDLSGEYGVSATFNVSDLSSFDVGDDSRLNPFEE
jgi:hypothetical protein